MKSGDQHVHRSGPLKQENKTHKTGRHRSNRSISTEGKGRKLDVKQLTRHKPELKRHERRNQMEQVRKQKREETLTSKRGLGGETTPPILVVVLDLNDNESGIDDDGSLKSKQIMGLIGECDENAVINNNGRNWHICMPRFKARYEFMTLDKKDLFASLDAVKVADILLVIHSIEPSRSPSTDQLLNSIYSHCLPTSLHIVNGLESVPTKKRNDVKKAIQKRIDLKFPNEKLRGVETPQDALQLMHQIFNCKRKSISFRKHRAQLLAENIEFSFENENVNENDSSNGTLKVSGYVRNCPLDVNSLVHIPGWGDFQMLLIEASNDPYMMVLNQRRAKTDISMDESGSESRIIQKCDPSLQESLEKENVPDAMDGEQTWPTPDELAGAESENKIIKRVPKGTSDYQATWIVEENDGNESGDEGDDVEGKEDSDDEESEVSEKDDMEVNEEIESDGDESEVQDDEYESMTITENSGNEANYDEKMDMSEDQDMLKKFKEQRMDEMFPDEVDTPMNVAAKVRFARYRGLKSFRTSDWDPKENLPIDYARIFQFENFNRTRKRVFGEERDGAKPGWYVTVHVKNVPNKLYEEFSQNKHAPLLLYALLPHEQKMTVMNLVVKKVASYKEPIKSKERLLFHVGCRRFYARPIFSAHTNGDKHKLERFLPTETSVVATIYAPITFPPASVLVYKEDEDGFHHLIATGSLLSCNPDRLIIKRIVLSGHPFKINRKTATVRYMFFNRDDIMWFNPVELRTKYGRKGHIKEPLGTHGHMKCTFDKQLKSQDTVLMNLYKRAYPKWSYDPCVRTSTIKVKSVLEKIDEEIDEEMS